MRVTKAGPRVALACSLRCPHNPQGQQAPQVPAAAAVFCPALSGCLATCHSAGRSVFWGRVPFVPPTVVQSVKPNRLEITGALQQAASPWLPSAPGSLEAPHPRPDFCLPFLLPGPLLAQPLSWGVCVCVVSAFLPGLLSHRGDPHDEFSAAALRAPLFVRSQVTQDVQDGVSTVVLGPRA